MQDKAVSMGLSENALRVLERRYLKKDVHGKVVETPEGMFRRVAGNIAKADANYGKKADLKRSEDQFFAMMTSGDFMPNSPTLMNAGKDLQQLSACFVLPIKDSMEGIFDSLKSSALIHKSGGGTGFSFSSLRAQNSVVRSTGGVASGPVSFMKVFDAATQAVKQGGTRRGANMGILKIDHPDILEFITCKANTKDITNFNISIMVTDEFMRKVENGEKYWLIDPHTKRKVQELNARETFDLIVEMAWKNGEPGIIFYDKLNADNPTPEIGMIESTNPCGEQPLMPYESCNLGSINLSKMVTDGKVEWKRLGEVVKGAVHFLDNVIDMNKFPLTIIREKTMDNRKIGLGVMGFADMLIRLKLPYDSQGAVEVAEEVMSFIHKKASDASIDLARERGVFKNFDKSVFKSKANMRLRNATLTTIAPTGTISIISNCSSGIAPLFAVSYIRKVMDNDEMVEIHPIFLEMANERGFYSEKLMKKIAAKGSVQDIDEVPEDIKRIFPTAQDIKPEYHIKMQAAFQKYTDNAVSKTINFPQDASKESVRKAYLLAFKHNCKGITIYRDKSREEQVLNIGSVNSESSFVAGAEMEAVANVDQPIPRPRPTTITGTTTKVTTGCGNLYVTINDDEGGNPFEVFMSMGKAGGCAGSQLEAIGRLVSLVLRSGVAPEVMISQLRGIRCPSPSWEKGGRIFSCSDAIARVLERRMVASEPEPDKLTTAEDQSSLNMPGTGSNNAVKTVNRVLKGNIVGVCPDCGGALRHEEGCQICASCGYSKC